MYPFWSPNNRQVGFFSERKLKTVDLSGGAVQIVCDAFGAAGGTWNNQGTIVFAETWSPSGVLAAGLMKVPATGGTPEPALNTNSPAVTLRWPAFLPDGDHFFYFAGATSGSVQRGVYVASLASKTSKMVSSDIVGTKFASGRLFYVRDRSLLAQPFDVKGLQTNGPPAPVAQQELQQDSFGRAGFSVSDTGVVVFQSAADNISRLAWFDRAGRELDEIHAIGYSLPALSRDGQFLVVSSDDDHNGQTYIHLYDFNRGTSTVTDAEVRELYNALGRHDGMFYFAAAADFDTDHKAQGDRLDFAHLFQAYRDQFPFLVGGSDEDPFEHRQVDLAQERLGKLGLQIERLPGGHLTTHEQPEGLAALITTFERSLRKKT